MSPLSPSLFRTSSFSIERSLLRAHFSISIMMAILFLALLIGCLTADPLPAVREGCGIADFENCIERDSIRPFFEERVMGR